MPIVVVLQVSSVVLVMHGEFVSLVYNSCTYSPGVSGLHDLTASSLYCKYNSTENFYWRASLF